MNRPARTLRVAGIARIAKEGAISAVHLYWELVLSARQLFPESPLRVIATSLRLRGVANRSKLEVVPIRSRNPQPQY